MARYEQSKNRRNTKERSPRRESSKNFEDSHRERYSNRDSPRQNRGRRDTQMTSVTCSGCGDKCEVPFKPTTNKPVYCKNCFTKKDSSRSSNKGLDILNEKLDKIIQMLENK